MPDLSINNTSLLKSSAANSHINKVAEITGLAIPQGQCVSFVGSVFELCSDEIIADASRYTLERHTVSLAEMLLL